MNDLLIQCDEVTRRRFVTGLAGCCLGVSLAPSFSIARAFAASPRTAARAEHLIYLFMSGGMSHLDTFDPKPGTSAQGPLTSIPTNVPGIHFSQHMAQTARLMDKLALIHGMHTTTGAHEQGRYYMRTGYTMRGTIKHPGVGTWLLRQRDEENPNAAAGRVLPDYVQIGAGSSDASAGFMPSRFGPLPLGSAAAGLPYANLTVPREQFIERLTLADAFDRPFRQHYNQKHVRSYTDLYADAIRLMDSQDLTVFDINREDPLVRDAYGANPFGQGCLLARRLVENGVRCVEVHMDGWDTHNDNFDSLATLAPQLDAALAALVNDLQSSGLLNSTLVVLATEFGRTPQINANQGRDHHPTAFSCLLAGAGVKPGQAHGKTDAKGDRVEDNGVNIPDFHATIGKALGLDLDKIYTSPSGRPFTFADKGKPVDALLS